MMKSSFGSNTFGSDNAGQRKTVDDARRFLEVLRPHIREAIDT
jgi:hypothetical protein